jgi:hypothetical protein
MVVLWRWALGIIVDRASSWSLQSVQVCIRLWGAASWSRWSLFCLKNAARNFFAPHPPKNWRIRFLRSNSTHAYRHDIIHYRLTKFYTGFRLIVVSLDKNMCARVDDRLTIFRAFSPAATGGQHWIDYRILYRQHRSILCKLLKSDYTKFALSINNSFVGLQATLVKWKKS